MSVILSPTKRSCDQVTEVAMAIAEQLAALGRSRQPIAIDAPLMLASLDPSAVMQLHSWLQTVYDWEDELRLLFDEDITAERLARDVVCRRGACSSPGKVVITPAATAPFAMQESQAVAGDVFLDIGMAPYESWTGKRSRKSSMLYGLLGLGLLGSPMSPSFHSPSAGSHLAPPSFTSPLLDPRAPSSAYTPIFSPWLKTVRFPAMEPVQSPWVPNLPRRSADGLWAFPQSPHGFAC